MSPSRASRRVVLVGCVLSVLVSGASESAAAGWWRADWPHRRLVITEQFEPTGLPAIDIAVVDMPTGGKIDLDKPKLRVVTSRGRLTPHCVLMTGPGDVIRLAFGLRAGVRRYHVYFGSAGAGKTDPLDIRRGVLLEMWSRPAGPIRTFHQVEKVFGKIGDPIGRGFRRRVFLGGNPFGPENRTLSRFTGWLICPADGEYLFCTSSGDASFLLIDDKLVVDNGGVHPPQRDTRVRGKIELTAGLHKLTVYCSGGEQKRSLVASWRPPGQERILPIPPAPFAPVFRATPEPMEDCGEAISIDFLPEHSGEALIAGRYYQRYAFKALAVGRIGRDIGWEWDFGDGQRSNSPEVQHVYLLGGTYTVKLTARRRAGELKRTNRIHVSRPWERVALNRLDTPARHAGIVATYEFERLEPQQMIRAISILSLANSSDAILAAGEAFLKRRRAGGGVVNAVVQEYVNALLACGQTDEAVDALEKAASISMDVAVSAKMLTHAGRILLDRKSDRDSALELFERAIQRYAPLASASAVRDARIGVGDVWRVRGEYAKAMKAYSAARPRPDDPTRSAIARGTFAHNVEDYIRRGEYRRAAEQLDEWERALPADKLLGRSTLLRVRLLAATGKHDEALSEAELLVKVNPRSNYAPDLLMAAAEGCKALGRVSEAKSALKLIVENYPESPVAPDAAKRL